MYFPLSRKVLFGALALAFATAMPAYAQQKSVAITAIVEHPALDSVRDGVKEALAAAGYEDGKNLKWQYQSAQGTTGTAAQIARKFAGDKFDVIVAIASPSCISSRSRRNKEMSMSDAQAQTGTIGSPNFRLSWADR